MQHMPTIRDEDKIVTATGDGKVSFVASDDVAAVAFRALTDEVPHNTDYLIFGPELFSYDEVSFSCLQSPPITHVLMPSEGSCDLNKET